MRRICNINLHEKLDNFSSAAEAGLIVKIYSVPESWVTDGVFVLPASAVGAGSPDHLHGCGHLLWVVLCFRNRLWSRPFYPAPANARPWR